MDKETIINISIKVFAIFLTLILILLMVLNAPIMVMNNSSDPSLKQNVSITYYLKNRQVMKYLEGDIVKMDSSQVELKSDAEQQTIDNDGLDLPQTIEGQFTILFLGFDSKTNDSGFLHDVNYLIQFNLVTASMNILQIPRDTFMPDYAGSTYKFNSIYYCGDSSVSRIQRVVNAVQENFGIPVDAYVTTTCDNVVQIVDIVGGIPIDMPYTVIYEADKVIYEGEQVLTGQQSEWFLRFRRGFEDGDIGRVQAQRYFLAAAMKKAISMGTFELVSAMNKVYDQELIGTDLSMGDISKLADLAGVIDMENVNVYMLPGEGAWAGDQSVWSVHKSAALDLLNEHFRTQQVPLQPEQSALVECVPEGEYMSTRFDDNGANLNDIENGKTENPGFKDDYSNEVGNY